jgi:IS605 OrfB family transposase
MIAYNVKLITQDTDFLKTTLREIQACYNFISDFVYRKLDIKQLSIKNIHHEVYYPARAAFPNLPAQIVIRIERQVYSNYQSVKSNKHEIEAPLISKSLSVRLDKRLFNRLTQTSIDLFSSTKQKLQTATFVLYPKVEHYLSLYEVSDPTLFERNGELYLSLPFKTPSPQPKDASVLGIDRGIRRLVATSDGLVIKGTEFQKHLRKLNYQKRCLQNKQTKSAKRKLAKTKRRIKHFSDNYCHHVANEVLKTDKSILVLENLKKIKSKTSKTKKGFKRKTHNRVFSQIPIYKLQFILTYKAQLVGKQVATVSPFKTSQLDCRGLENGIRCGCRYYAVDNSQLDADINAAVNIANRYGKHLSSQYPENEDICFKSRLSVNQPNVANSFV